MNFINLFNDSGAAAAYVHGRINKGLRKAFNILTETPCGKIRFVGMEKQKLISSILGYASKNYRESVSEEIVLSCYENSFFKDKNNFFEFDDFMGLEGSSFGLYSFDKKYSKSIVFYANNIDKNDRFEDDLIKFWIEEYVVPSFNIALKSVSSENEIARRNFYYTPILKAIEHFGHVLSEKEQYDIFQKYLSKYNINLEKIKFNNGFKEIIINKRTF